MDAWARATRQQSNDDCSGGGGVKRREPPCGFAGGLGRVADGLGGFAGLGGGVLGGLLSGVHRSGVCVGGVFVVVVYAREVVAGVVVASSRLLGRGASFLGNAASGNRFLKIPKCLCGKQILCQTGSS